MKKKELLKFDILGEIREHAGKKETPEQIISFFKKMNETFQVYEFHTPRTQREDCIVMELISYLKTVPLECLYVFLQSSQNKYVNLGKGEVDLNVAGACLNKIVVNEKHLFKEPEFKVLPDWYGYGNYEFGSIIKRNRKSLLKKSNDEVGKKTTKQDTVSKMKEEISQLKRDIADLKSQLKCYTIQSKSILDCKKVSGDVICHHFYRIVQFVKSVSCTSDITCQFRWYKKEDKKVGLVAVRIWKQRIGFDLYVNDDAVKELSKVLEIDKDYNIEFNNNDGEEELVFKEAKV